jgi:pimeloyl-ACP methyl ester carboxylesterase
MPEFTVNRPDGAELSCRVEGKGTDLLLITGLSGSGAFWQPVMPVLTRRFRVATFDQRGIGASSRGKGGLSIAMLADDAFAVMKQAGFKRPLVLGHSMGGIILQQLALEHPKCLSGAILSGTWAKPNPYMAELFRARGEVLKASPREYSAMLAFLAYPPDWLDQHWPFYRAMLDNAPKSVAAQTVMLERMQALLVFDRSKDVAGISVPVAVQGAEDDLIVPAFLQRELAQMIPGAALSMLPNGGHFFPVTRPEGFLRTVVAHAERIGTLAC